MICLGASECTSHNSFFLIHEWFGITRFSWSLDWSPSSIYLRPLGNRHLSGAGKDSQIQYLTWTWIPPFRASLDRAKASSGPIKGLLWLQEQWDDGGFLPARTGFCNFPAASGNSSSWLTMFGAGVRWGGEVAASGFRCFLRKNYLPQTRDKTRSWNRQMEGKGLGIFLSQRILWLFYGDVIGGNWCHGKFYF